MRGRRQLWVKSGIIGLILLFIFAATYYGIALYFKDHYYYHTVIGGKDFSYKTPIEAEEILYSTLYDYSLEIAGRDDVSDTIVAAEIDMEFILDDSLIRIKQEQNPGMWILGFFKEYHYDFPWKVAYDESALEEKMKQLSFFQKKNIKKPKDSYLMYSKEEKEYIIVEAEQGTETIEGKVEEEIQKALGGLVAKIDLEEKGCYKNAGVNEADETLTAVRDKANKYVHAEITYLWNGNDVIVDADIIHEWLIIDGNSVSLDENRVEEFISEQAKKYDTYGKNRIFYTSDGREIELKSGAYGWRTDKDTEKQELLKALKNGEVIQKEPAYSYTAAQPGEKDIGDTYVEIDLGSQHLYLYVDGILILESDFVSGNAARGWNTPAGVFGLTYKTRNAVLRGDNYETPVSYWMPFNGNIGMHDATWRNSFGGDIYLTNGSHGCINLPAENAEIIYEYVYTGFPVICYY